MLGKEKLSTYYSKETFREHLRSLGGYLGKKKIITGYKIIGGKINGCGIFRTDIVGYPLGKVITFKLN